MTITLLCVSDKLGKEGLALPVAKPHVLLLGEEGMKRTGLILSLQSFSVCVILSSFEVRSTLNIYTTQTCLSVIIITNWKVSYSSLYFPVETYIPV